MDLFEIIIVVVIAILLIGICFCATHSYANLDYVKERAEGKWAEVGFEIIGYDGYNWGWTFVFNWKYGGAKVWHVLKKGDITYWGYLQRWGNEIHVYNLKAIDAIKP